MTGKKLGLINFFSSVIFLSEFYLRPSSAISAIGSTEPWGNCGADPTNIIVFLEIIRLIADTFTLNIKGYRWSRGGEQVYISNKMIMLIIILKIHEYF